MLYATVSVVTNLNSDISCAQGLDSADQMCAKSFNDVLFNLNCLTQVFSLSCQCLLHILRRRLVHSVYEETDAGRYSRGLFLPFTRINQRQ